MKWSINIITLFPIKNTQMETSSCMWHWSRLDHTLTSTCSSVRYLAGLVVLQPALQVSSIGPGMKAASLKGLEVPGGWEACSHHCMESVVEGRRVLVSPLVLWSLINSHTHTNTKQWREFQLLWGTCTFWHSTGCAYSLITAEWVILQFGWRFLPGTRSMLCQMGWWALPGF